MTGSRARRANALVSAFIGCCAVLYLTPATARAADAEVKAQSPQTSTAANGSTKVERDSRSYRVAVGGGLSAGGPGWGTEMGDIWEVNARAQVLPWLGAGAAFFDLRAPNNESTEPFHARAVTLHASAHPLPKFIVDPFVRVDAVYFVNFKANDFDPEPDTRIGVEGRTGVNLSLPHFAVGVHLRHGLSTRTWTMFGLHLEGRL